MRHCAKAVLVHPGPVIPAGPGPWSRPLVPLVPLVLLGPLGPLGPKDKKGTSVLLHVTGKTDPSFAQTLIAARCNPGHHNKDFDCALFRAAKARHMDVMKVLLGQEWTPPEEETWWLSWGTAGDMFGLLPMLVWSQRAFVR